MYEYALDSSKEQKNSRDMAFEYIYRHLPENYDPSNISFILQSNGATTSVFYKGRFIGVIYGYYDGTTWHISSNRVPFDKEDGERNYEHLVDVTCSWDEIDGFRNRKYAISPGYSYEDLTDAEKKIIDSQKEDL